MTDYQFDHMHLTSADPVKTAEFYRQHFGAKLSGLHNMGDGRTVVKLTMNGVTILVTTATEESGLAHFGIRTNDLESAVNALKAEGVEFTRDVTEIRPGLKISFFKAPDNAIVELLEEKSP